MSETNNKSWKTDKSIPYRSGLCTVDAAVINFTNDKILLGQKKTKNQWRLFGGFVEKFDENFMSACVRELKEESCLVDIPIVHCFEGIKVDDLRYVEDRVGIFTSIYVFAYKEAMGIPAPGDDLKGGKVKWFNIKELSSKQIVPEHVKLLNIILNWYYGTPRKCNYV